jgi:hypothetical protein
MVLGVRVLRSRGVRAQTLPLSGMQRNRMGKELPLEPLQKAGSGRVGSHRDEGDGRRGTGSLPVETPALKAQRSFFKAAIYR